MMLKVAVLQNYFVTWIGFHVYVDPIIDI